MSSLKKKKKCNTRNAKKTVMTQTGAIAVFFVAVRICGWHDDNCGGQADSS